jgi:predicted nucleic acid-binding protein
MVVDVPLFVVDASVVARWYLPSPPHLDLAHQVRTDYEADRIGLTAPDNLRVEVGGAFHQAMRAHFIQSEDSERWYYHFLDWEIPMVETAELLRPAYRLSLDFGCSFYDAIYLALSRQEDLPFLHADQRLHNALGGRFPQERWIQDYLRP